MRIPVNSMVLVAWAFLLSAMGSQAAAQSSSSAEPPLPPHERAVASDDTLTAVAGTNRFAFDLFAQLRQESDGNLLFSPLSISTALGMTYAGARGNTAEEMAAVLHYDLPHEQLHPAMGALIRDLNLPREGYELALKNRLFGQEGFPFHPEFLDTVQQGYDAPLLPLDFIQSPEPSRLQINQWVAEQTNNRIENLLPPGSIRRDSRLVLTNTLYFNGQWKYKFDAEATQSAPFYLNPGESVEAPLMFQKQQLRHGHFEDYQMLELPYAGDDLSMLVLLPDAVDGLAELEQQLTVDQFEQDVARLNQREVLTWLPKFSFEDSLELAPRLQNLGMVDAFSPAADFTGMADNLGLRISDIFHQTFIDVNEEGTEAAAATAVVVGVTSVTQPMPPAVFRADHPFLFALRDNATGSLLFLGRMSDPNVASRAWAVPEPQAIPLICSVAVMMSLARRGGGKRLQKRKPNR